MLQIKTYLLLAINLFVPGTKILYILLRTPMQIYKRGATICVVPQYALRREPYLQLSQSSNHPAKKHWLQSQCKFLSQAYCWD